jgi:hypothetical protein
MEDIVPGFNEAKESLLAKLEEPINMYLLVKLKLAQFRDRGDAYYIKKELKENLMIHAREIDEILSQDIENQ